MAKLGRFLTGDGERWKKKALVGSVLSGAIVIILAVGAILTSGGERATDAVALNREPEIFPDYRNVAIPPNVAPLNFDIQETGNKFWTRVSVVKTEIEDSAEISKNVENLKNDADGNDAVAEFFGKEIRFPLKKWRAILSENAGKSLCFEIFAKQNDGKWGEFDDWTMRITSDPIDSWVSYRLIEPGYEHYSNLELWSRNLDSFEERAIFRARLIAERTCVNCHSFQAGKTDSFLFHIRETKGGTVVVDRGDVKKVDLNADGLVAGCAYPAWHPTAPLVALSTNSTFQIFHSKSSDLINVMDAYSDLVLYDVAKNEITSVIPQGDEFLETYPTWSPDGKTLYFCRAKSPDYAAIPNLENGKPDLKARQDESIKWEESIKYNLMRVAFDEKTRTFGEPELVFNAVKLDKTSLFPRVSPDGKTLLFTLARRGCFSIWYRDADLWTLDLATGTARPLDETNSPDEPDSFHSWDSSGRWFVFSSRRDDGAFTRLYFAHFDKNGRASKPFLLPQRDPKRNLTLMKSFNVPEMTVESVKISERKLLEKAKIDAPEKAVYR